MATTTDGQVTNGHVGRIVQMIGSTFDTEFERRITKEIAAVIGGAEALK